MMHLDIPMTNNLRKIFSFFAIGEGPSAVITPASLQQILYQLGNDMPVDALVPLLEPHCSDLQQGLTFENFLLFYAAKTKNINGSEEMKEAFRVLDDNLDGLVEIEKIAPMLPVLLPNRRPAEINKLLDQLRQLASEKSYDDRPNVIDYDAFVKFIFI